MADRMLEIVDYAEVHEKDPLSGEDVRASCRRFLRDMDENRWELRTDVPEFCIRAIETLFCHQQGEDLHGRPLRGTPLILQPWQLFCAYNIAGWHYPGTDIRRFQEALLMLARKNGKTPFATALLWTLGLWYSASFSKIKTVAGSLRQGMEGFGFLRYNLHRLGLTRTEDPKNGLRELDSSLGHSYEGKVWRGQISFDALAYKPDIFDAFNCNFVHLDELELYRNAIPYGRLKDATKAYTNKLLLATTTAGDDGTGFCAQRCDYCSRIVRGEITGEDADRVFVFMARADPDPETGEVDYLSPVAHQQANPSWGVTIRPSDMMASALQAKNDPQMRPEFITRSLNNFVSSVKAWFDVETFRKSDAAYNWTLDELAKLPVKWYGGTDLARLYDLTAACLVGEYKDVLIIIPHCWFPVTAATEKADKDQIPLFGWQDDGWLDMSNDAVTDHQQVVAWYKAMRARGFNIAQIGHDPKFCPEYVTSMKRARFKIVTQLQHAYLKSEGFRHIEKRALQGKIYYCHAEPFEYCVGNVHAREKDDAMIFDKINPSSRIDVFDAATFAATRMLIHAGKVADTNAWFDTRKEEKS